MKLSRALTGVCLITLFLLVSSQDADAAKKAKKVKADETITNKVREQKKRRGFFQRSLSILNGRFFFFVFSRGGEPAFDAVASFFAPFSSHGRVYNIFVSALRIGTWNFERV